MKKIHLVAGALFAAALLSPGIAAAGDWSLIPKEALMKPEDSARLTALGKRIDGLINERVNDGKIHNPAGRSSPGSVIGSAVVSGPPGDDRGKVVAELERIVDKHHTDTGKMLTKIVEHLEARRGSDGVAHYFEGALSFRRQYGTQMLGMPDAGSNWEKVNAHLPTARDSHSYTYTYRAGGYRLTPVARSATGQPLVRTDSHVAAAPAQRQPRSPARPAQSMSPAFRRF